MVLRIPVSTDEFKQMVGDNADRDLELIAGEVIEKMVSNPRSSAIGAFIAGLLAVFVRQHDLGRVTGADGGYVIGEDRYIPDAAFMSKVRQAVQPSEAYNPLAPDLAVEVLSPTNDDEQMRVKVVNYLAAGTIVWVVDPDKERIDLHQPGQPVRVLRLDDTLEGGALLPGFSVAVREVFA